ncbi:phage tail family protein [Clostridium felsineum]|uniref:distal tail protein Dit n=1 Tax=Clostridium felsineum TaxID=36839 RepID=UPI00214D564B|nr:distal tail protein Dit [Clostridium felsineum]MCR3759145.1 phage tail family protein [Clostridium felsineum]
MANYGFSFNGKHSITDMGVIMEYKKIQPPAKKKLKLAVPYMNGMYDFSTIGSGGEQVFEQRTINVKIDLLGRDKTKEDLQKLYSRVCEWLLNCSKSKLVFDDDTGFFYMAEVENISSWEETWYWGFMEFVFTCDPFKYGATYYGSDLLWDNLDFDLPDYIQQSRFTISGTQTVYLYVPWGHSFTPNVVVDSNMTCTLNNYTATFGINSPIDYGFRLLNGTNVITITGNGNIEFQFRKEML